MIVNILVIWLIMFWLKMKIKSIILTAKGMYAVSNDINTIFNKMNEPYFFADTLFSKEEKSDLPCFSGALAYAESNDFYKSLGEEPKYIIGHMQVVFNTSKVEAVYPMGRDISGVEKKCQIGYIQRYS